MTKVKIPAIASFAMVAAAMPSTTLAERADYNQIELTGLARDVSWSFNRPGETRAMVCNVNGPDGYLSIRSGPGADHAEARRLKRLATVKVDTRERRGLWVRILGAYRSFSEQGKRQEYQPLPVSGWAHDGYLCSFIDYPAPGDFDRPDDAGTFSPEQSDDEVILAQADGKPALCEWNNGTDGPTERYRCRFIPFDGNGSFSVIRDDGYELMLTVEGSGTGSLVEFLDGRRGLEFGRVRRSRTDPACWEAENGSERLCAR